MSAQSVDTYETRTPDAGGWRDVPFRHPEDMPAEAMADVGALATAGDDDGKHDGGPMPPEAPREPDPGGGDDE